MEAQDNPEFKEILNRADLCVPDGVPLVWLSRLAGHANTGRVFGPDLMLCLSAALAETRASVFYYGGGPKVAENLARRMNINCPGLRTAGTHCPPFRDLTKDEESEIIELINRSGAHILWVGLSTPKQEQWMAKFRHHLNVPVLVGVGAAFDYNTGRLRRAPKWMQRAGLEWLFRTIQEPRRLWRRYVRNNPRFIFYVPCEKLGLRDFSNR